MLHAVILLALGQAAAEPMTLDRALAIADQAHVDVKLADLALSQARQDQVSTYTYIYPKVDAFAQASIGYYAPSTQITTFPVADPTSGATTFQTSREDIPGSTHPDFNLGVQLAQKIYDGGRWWTAIAKGKDDLAAAEAQLKEARLQVHATVAHLFFELVRAERSLAILEVNVQRSQEQVDRADALFQAGRGPKSDAFAARVNLANDRISSAQQRAKRDLARNSLNVALGRAAELAVDAQPPDLAARPPAPNASQLEQQAVDARHGLVSLRDQVESAKKSVTIARADYYPSLNATASYVRDSPAPELVVGNPARQYVATGALNLSWNLFQGHSTDIAVQKAELAQAQAGVQLEKSVRSVREETQRAARTLGVELESLDLAEQAHAAAQDGLALASERFKAGAASNLEVRDAQLKLTSAELTLVSTQVDLQLARIDVQAALGQL